MMQKNSRLVVYYSVLVSIFTLQTGFAQEDEPMSIPEPTDPIVQPVNPPAAGQPPETRSNTQSTKQNSQPRKRQSVDEIETWGVLISPGFTLSNSTTYKTTSSGGTTTAADSTSVSDNSGLIFGIEGDYRFKTYFQLCAALELSKYNHTGGVISDTHIGFFLIPRAQYETNRAVYWAGLGLGLMSSSFGSDPATTLTTSSSTGVALSPRIGVDFETGTMFLAGFQVALTTFSGTVDVSGATAAGTPVAISQDFSRKWFTLQGRFGIRF